MSSAVKAIEDKYRKHHVVDVRSGDTVKVHQKIREGNKERVQIFEGLVIRTDRRGSHTSSITVRRIASGVGVEKTYLLHSPLVVKVEVSKRGKVRRNYLTYMRARTGKSARLASVAFDRAAVNEVPEEPAADTATKEVADASTQQQTDAASPGTSSTGEEVEATDSKKEAAAEKVAADSGTKAGPNNSAKEGSKKSAKENPGKRN